MHDRIRTQAPVPLLRTSDRDFYAFPRLVKHVDDGFLRQLTQLYRQACKSGV